MVVVDVTERRLLLELGLVHLSGRRVSEEEEEGGKAEADHGRGDDEPLEADQLDEGPAERRPWCLVRQWFGC